MLQALSPVDGRILPAVGRRAVAPSLRGDCVTGVLLTATPLTYFSRPCC